MSDEKIATLPVSEMVDMPQMPEQLRALSIVLDRMDFMRQAGVTFKGKRDAYEVLGYADVITTSQYLARYSRGGIAGRVIDVMPDATWRGLPAFEVVEDKDKTKDTAFELAMRNIVRRLQVDARFHRVDKLARMSTYAVLLIGMKDGLLQEEMPHGKGKDDDILYLAPFLGGGGPGIKIRAGNAVNQSIADDPDATIAEYNIDPASARFGLPEFYQLRRTDAAAPLLQTRCHWSRILHVAEGLLDNDVFGMPALERVWNLLDDLDKVTGGGAEAFWLRANQGLHLDIDKDLALPDVTSTVAALKDQAEEYKHQMTRWLRTRGVNVQTLGSDVANFGPPADAIITQIAGAKAIPKRILTGSEMGELASSQDRENFKDQVNGRQTQYAGPQIVRQFVDRLIEYNYVPAPAGGPSVYEVKWPHMQVLTEDEKAAGAQKWASVNSTAGRTIFTEDEIRDHWYGMGPGDEADDEMWRAGLAEKMASTNKTQGATIFTDDEIRKTAYGWDPLTPEQKTPITSPEKVSATAPTPEIDAEGKPVIPPPPTAGAPAPNAAGKPAVPAAGAKPAPPAPGAKPLPFAPKAPKAKPALKAAQSTEELIRVLAEAIEVGNMEVIEELVTAGDVPGHDFHGNQWSHGVSVNDKTVSVHQSRAAANVAAKKLRDKGTRAFVFAKPNRTYEDLTPGDYKRYNVHKEDGTLIHQTTDYDEAHRKADEENGYVKDTGAKPRALGDVEGHEFHGNQWKGGRGAAKSGGAKFADMQKQGRAILAKAQQQVHDAPTNTEEEQHQQELADKQTSPNARPTFVLGMENDDMGETGRYVAAYGQDFEAQPRPSDVEQGTPKECYKNASLLVLERSDLTYAEGWAKTKGTGDLAFMHAWAVDKNNKVVDPTWKDGHSYFGVKYDRSAYLQTLYKNKFYGVLGGTYKTAHQAINTGAAALRGEKLKTAGDVEGHEFHGNQFTVHSGTGEVHSSHATLAEAQSAATARAKTTGVRHFVKSEKTGKIVSNHTGKTAPEIYQRNRFNALGDVAGHEFHGNQWTAGQGSKGGGELDKPASAYPKMHPNGRDTKEQYSDGKGHYSTERLALHDAIIKKYMEGTTPVEKPVATIIGGGMASGKSTMVNAEGLAKGNTVDVNVDKIRSELPEVKDMIAKGEKMNVELAHEEASDISARMIKESVNTSRNLTLDGTGNTTLEKLGGKVAVMRAGGHSIEAYYVTVPVAEAQIRADQRARETDRRFVDPVAMASVHGAVSRIFPEAIRQGLFDSAKLYNTEGPFGSKPTLVASSVGKTLTVHHDQYWKDFIGKGVKK